MSFALLALLCAVAMLGPIVSLNRMVSIPVVIGELLVGIVLGRTGFGVVDASDPTLSFMAEIGFALVMFVAGTHVQVVRVGQLDLAADRLQILRRERALDGRLRADIHKHRRLNRTVRRREFPAARMTVLANQLKHSLLAFLL